MLTMPTEHGMSCVLLRKARVSVADKRRWYGRCWMIDGACTAVGAKTSFAVLGEGGPLEKPGGIAVA
jgi:hypothetical protein